MRSDTPEEAKPSSPNLNPTPTPNQSPIIRGSLIMAGWIAILLGILGIFLPILPTTPFLLLAAYCFSKSSPRFHRWLLHHPYLGSWIRDYYEKNGLTLRRKIGILILMWSTMTLSMVIIGKLWAMILLLLLGSIGSAFIITRHTLPPAPLKIKEQKNRESGKSKK